MIQAILWPVVSWVFREVLIKFVIFTAIFALVALLVPVAVQQLAPWVGAGWLNSAFGAIGPGVWWFLDMFRLSYGVPLVIAAFVSRFLIRRLPVIG